MQVVVTGNNRAVWWQPNQASKTVELVMYVAQPRMPCNRTTKLRQNRRQATSEPCV